MQASSDAISSPDVRTKQVLDNDTAFQLNYAVFNAMYCNQKTELSFDGVKFSVWYSDAKVHFKSLETGEAMHMKIASLGPKLAGSKSLWRSIAHQLRWMIKVPA